MRYPEDKKHTLEAIGAILNKPDGPAKLAEVNPAHVYWLFGIAVAAFEECNPGIRIQNPF